eukprot:m.45021 g.45021  ORF g.45021 m.45021 type:complete len:725 (+) comp10173_c0_seq4:117-2291(+)
MAYLGVEGSEGRSVRDRVVPPATDLKRWSLEVSEGRQVWNYLGPGEAKQNPAASAYWTGLDVNGDTDVDKKDTSDEVTKALRCGVNFFSSIQTADGHWSGDYGGPMFLLPGYAIVMYVTGLTVPEPYRLEIVRYLSNTQIDGGWGIHIESSPTVFGTSLNYCVMRLLGVPREDERMQRARTWLSTRRGCLGIPSWGKFWLAVLGVYSWDGVHSLFPEMVLLPRAFPLHTCRLWSYCRTVYMPMSYIYGRKFVGSITPLVKELREELILEPYDQVNWPSVRNFVAEEDLYTPHTWALDLFFSACNLYEKVAPSMIRNWALDWVYEVLKKEDEFTNYITIGPVSKMINMLCAFLHEGRESLSFRKHIERIPDYMWMGKDGMKMNGTNGSQLWDTSFMIQAMIESGIKDEFKDVFRKAHDYIDITQIRVDHPKHNQYYRDITKGGWPFSTRDMGWIVADCTGEGLKAALICKKFKYTATALSDERMYDAVNILLSMQNSTGGYATCEKTRGWHFFEYFNASEVFGEIMIDYDYVECTSSALQALCLFREMYPKHRTTEINRAIKNALSWMLTTQREDGSWEGLWGICFTYGTWFGVEGLVDAGLPPSHPRIQAACNFLVSKQQDDGGWGETFMSCVTREYVQHPQSQVVNTAWAVLTLLKAKYSDRNVIKRGVELLLSRQKSNGDWEQESISGVFNKNCMISYSNYKNIFPLWAIGRYRETYPDIKA